MEINLTFCIQVLNTLISVFCIRFFLVKPFVLHLEKKAQLLATLVQETEEECLAASKLKLSQLIELKAFQQQAQRFSPSLQPGLNLLHKQAIIVDEDPAQMIASKDLIDTNSKIWELINGS
jgi:hypothetical protein